MSNETPPTGKPADEAALVEQAKERAKATRTSGADAGQERTNGGFVHKEGEAGHKRTNGGF